MRKSIEENRRTAHAIRQFLLKVISNPSEFANDVGLITALKRQGLLAKYSDPQNNIHASSLNTLKRTADQVLDGGFNALDHLRRRALTEVISAIEKKDKANRGTKAELVADLCTIKLENQNLREDLLLMTYILKQSLTQGLLYASEGKKSTLDRCVTEQKALRQLMNLKKSNQKSNVVSIREL